MCFVTLTGHCGSVVCFRLAKPYRSATSHEAQFLQQKKNGGTVPFKDNDDEDDGNEEEKEEDTRARWEWTRYFYLWTDMRP